MAQTLTKDPPEGGGPAGTTVRLVPDRWGGGVVLRVHVLPAALLLIGVQVILTGSRLARSWWWQDDLNILAIARGRFGPDLLLHEYTGHLVPGSFLLAWLFDRTGELAWWPAALVTLLMVILLDAVLLGLLWRLFGPRPGILIPLAVYLASSLTLTSTVWWAAAMQWLPATGTMLLALYGHVGFMRHGRRRDAVIVVVAILLGFFFFEKTLTTPVLLGLYSIAYHACGNPLARIWRVVVRHRVYWLVQVAWSVGFLALYLSRVSTSAGAVAEPGTPLAGAYHGHGPGPYLTLIRIMIFDTLLPGLAGGPLRWFSQAESSVNSWSDPVLPMVLLSALVAAVAIVGSVRARPGAWRSWLLLAAFLAMSIALVAWARLQVNGPALIGRDHRYLTDVAALTAVCLALAWLPMRPGYDEGLAPPRERTRASRAAARGPLMPAGPAGIAGLVVIVLVTVGGLVSGERLMSTWTKNPSQAYFEEFRSSLAASRRPVYMFTDQYVPDGMMLAAFGDARSLANLTRPLARRPVFRDWAPSISTVQQDGTIVPAAIDAQPYLLPAPVCAGDGARIVVKLLLPIPKWRWKIQLGYLAGRPSTGDVRLGVNGKPIKVDFTEKLGNLYLDTTAGPAATVIVDNLAPGSAVCIGSVTIGQALKPSSP